MVKIIAVLFIAHFNHYDKFVLALLSTGKCIEGLAIISYNLQVLYDIYCM